MVKDHTHYYGLIRRPRVKNNSKWWYTYLIYCNIFIVHTKFTKVAVGWRPMRYSITIHLYIKKIHLQTKRISSIHLIGGWVPLGADLGVSKKRKFSQNPTLLQQPVSQHVKGTF
jgi:hypothetical protein